MQKPKQVLVKYWLKKAQRDLAAVQKIAADLPDIAIYHCQQGAEKALKAFLILRDIEPRNTHNIKTLIQQASAVEPDWLDRLDDASILS